MTLGISTGLFRQGAWGCSTAPDRQLPPTKQGRSFRVCRQERAHRPLLHNRLRARPLRMPAMSPAFLVGRKAPWLTALPTAGHGPGRAGHGAGAAASPEGRTEPENTASGTRSGRRGDESGRARGHFLQASLIAGCSLAGVGRPSLTIVWNRLRKVRNQASIVDSFWVYATVISPEINSEETSDA